MKPVHIGLIVAALLIGAATWFFYLKKKKETSKVDEKTTDETKKRTVGDAKIRAIQQQLNAALPVGYTKLLEDGIWGAKTQAAITELTKTGKLPADLLYLLKDVVTEKTFPDEIEYKKMADEVFAAISGVNNIYRVKAVLNKLKTPTDFQLLIKGFGTRKSKLTPFESGLIGWFNNDLSTNDLKTVEDVLNGIGATLKM